MTNASSCLCFAGEMGFNVVVGGYMSTKRVATSVELDMWVPPSEVVNLCYSIIRVSVISCSMGCLMTVRTTWAYCALVFAMSLLTQLFRDNANRKDRQKARLLWVIEEWGLEKFRDAVIQEMKDNKVYGGREIRVEKHQHHTGE